MLPKIAKLTFVGFMIAGSLGSASIAEAAPDAPRETITVADPSGKKAVPNLTGVGLLQSNSGSCTAVVVAGGRGNIIATNAHCVSEKTGLRFMPQYHAGQTPVGSFPIYSFTTINGWTSGGYGDVSFAVVGKNASGQMLSSVAHPSGITFNGPKSGNIDFYGYDASGTLYLRCENQPTASSTSSSSVLKTACKSVPGASGGPWFEYGKNQIKALNYGGTESASYASYLDGGAFNTYNKAVEVSNKNPSW
ncbi:hypothetical protein OHS59_38345 [Streptomyces sp. NBC_00414]|uniref:trypsin-like serine peptidase n=1 Tax=Streptomyces sp. NBC_00414 TaxID=2975739 RepID=UPI002E1ECE4C